MTIARSVAIAAALLLSACATQPADRPQAPVMVASGDPQVLTVPIDGRSVAMSLFRPAQRPRGVLLLSHGAGGSPARMRPLIDPLVAAGFAIIAPLHPDSLDVVAAERADLQAAFPLRIADLAASAMLGERLFPGVAQGAVGYSYGSLVALAGGGALSAMIPARVPTVRAVASWSSPGLIPGVVTDEGLASVAVPTLMITGTSDVVPGFIPDAAQHVRYFEAQPAGGRTLAVVDGASHEFVYGREPGHDAAIRLTVDFLLATVADDRDAGRRLAAAADEGPMRIRRR